MQDLHSYSDETIVTGALFALPSTALLNDPYVRDLIGRQRVVAIDSSDLPLLEVINDALWSSASGANLPFYWAAVAGEQVETGRASLPTLRALSTLALARLREITKPPPAAEPPAPKTPEPAARKSPLLARPTIRIKA